MDLSPLNRWMPMPIALMAPVSLTTLYKSSAAQIIYRTLRDSKAPFAWEWAISTGWAPKAKVAVISATNQPAAPAREPLQFLKIIKTRTVKIGEKAKIHLTKNKSVISTTNA